MQVTGYRLLVKYACLNINNLGNEMVFYKSEFYKLYLIILFVILAKMCVTICIIIVSNLILLMTKLLCRVLALKIFSCTISSFIFH